jgi:glycosyltransferase involved in cell wall biosynthesis
MTREAPRTLFSLSAAYQRDISVNEYEVIVVDNGSIPPFDANVFRQIKGNFRLIRMEGARPSPVRAINRGLAEARGKLVGVMIDGARIASPGLIALSGMAGRLADRAVILTLGFHLGSEVQMKSVLQGYNQEEENRLLEQSGWTEDGYRLFDVSVFAGSSAGGWFKPINESNAIFMRKSLWDELGGFDDKFQTPGGGYVNLDTLARAVALPRVTVVTLLGEGTFHQVHGGVATNATHNVQDAMHAEYMNVRGRPFQAPVYQSLYIGSVPLNVLPSIGDSSQMRLLREQEKRHD